MERFMSNSIVRSGGEESANQVAGTAGPQIKIPQILWNGRWIILVMIALGAGGGFAYLSQQIAIYSSGSQILIESEGVKIIENVDGVRSQSANYLPTQCALLKSSQILGPVAELPEIQQMKTFAGTDNPIGRLKAGLTAEAGVKDDLIYVSFESTEPQEAASVVNAVVGSFKAYHTNRQRSNNAEVLKILTREKRERDVELQEKSRKMLAFRQAHPGLMLDSSGKSEVLLGQLQKLSDALTVVRMEYLDAKAAYDAVQAMAKDPMRMAQWQQQQQQTTADNTPLRAEAQRLELELSIFRQTLLADHPRVKAAESQLEAIRQRISAQSNESFSAQRTNAEQRMAFVQMREAELVKSSDALRNQVMSQNTEGAEFMLMEAEAKRIEKLCDLLDTRMKEVKITENVQPLTVTVLEPARASMIPVKPKRGTIMFQAIIAGLMLGCGIAYLRAMLDKRIGVLDEVPAKLRMSVLGVLPQMSARETIGVRGQKVELDPMSDEAESYRSIRTAISFGASDVKAKTILVTSSVPGEGKTTSASNLAIAMAQAGKQVLLIDCDFRQPMQHRVFGIEDGLGIISVIAGQAPISKAVKATSTPGLFLLPCGPIPPNPAEILSGRTFAQIIAKAKQRFDCIIIDSPPVLPVTDAQILAASCDITVIVVRMHKTKWRDAIRASESLTSVGSRLLGVVVNAVPRHMGKNGYYAYGSYSYGNRKAAKLAMRASKDKAEVRAKVRPATD
ncbi:GumC family protein [Humisphaera borealis]|uniref:non-specific protein-tyrosine kinase n=1 Tax=Humisphaera borealis TaxID=2807512 RepID=A0A7M2X0J6_9BACT|nr:polysaccharide biosynthesis tyrosine autokinase [Humisphaera borealis]QOV90621.1 polysaccharide biosynthesis tyrosine autokinase [Humisphaera borealis]